MSATDTRTNERPGVRAVHRHARFSAYKAREVLDLIRGLPVGEARTVLAFSERACARDIAKVLDSAVANAANNNDIPPEELYVSACFADEGPTLKRWRPRARGRATRIRKRTCHVTVIVGRYSPDELARIREREARSGRPARDAAAARARRVARSRKSEPAKESEATAEAEDTEDLEVTAAEETATSTFAEDAADAGVAEDAPSEDEATASDETASDEGDASDEAAEAGNEDED